MKVTLNETIISVEVYLIASLLANVYYCGGRGVHSDNLKHLYGMPSLPRCSENPVCQALPVASHPSLGPFCDCLS